MNVPSSTISTWRRPGAAFLMLAAAILLLEAGPCRADDTIVVFRTGKAMRVSSFREEGDWVFLTVSSRPNPRDEPSELGVRRASILRFEKPQATSPGVGGLVDSASGHSANGPVLSLRDSLAAALSSTPGGGTLQEAYDKVVVPPEAEPDPNAIAPEELGAPGGGETEEPAFDENDTEIDPAKATYGYTVLAPLRNLKPGPKYLKRAIELNSQRRAERAAKQAEQAAGVANPAPAPTSPPAPPAPPVPEPTGGSSGNSSR